MPPKRKTKSKRPKKASTSSNNELATVTRMLKQMNNRPGSEVTDLGRLLLKGGNIASSFFGFPKIFGSGSYAMTNSLWNATSQVPIMHSSNESVRIKHREYIGDITMNGANFLTYPFAINPGLASTFPYLSAVAQNFQEYSFKGLVFEYKSTSATALVSGTNTAMGSVMLAAQYRADAPIFVNKTQLLNEMWSVDTVPSQNTVLPVECAPAETVLPKQYIRTGAVTGDIKLFDLCTLTVATFGAQTGQNNVVGELWASYDVELCKPQVSSTVSAPGSSAYYGISNSWSTNNLFGGVLPSAASTIAITTNLNTLSFPVGSGGYYLISIAAVAAGTYAGFAPVYVNMHAASNNVVTNFFGLGALQGDSFGVVVLLTAPANAIATFTVPTGSYPTDTGILGVSVIALPNLPNLWGV
jgi:hypothetical protein